MSRKSATSEMTQMKNQKSVDSPGHLQTTRRTRAKATVTVQTAEAVPYDHTVSPALMEIRLSETFSGDIEGESPVRAL